MSRYSGTTPFIRQCFVTLAVTLTTMQQALLNGFSSVLVPQLRQEGHMVLNQQTESWIASIHNISMILGILIVPFTMERYGRKVANSLNAVLWCITWFCISICSDIFCIILIKLIQGLCSGMTAISGAITVGEYASPKLRGAFLTMIASSLSFGMIVVHGIGTVLSWQNTARVFGTIMFIDCLMILYSPESPSFLAAQGRFEECRKAFHWLRYSEEEAELEKLIKVNMRKIEGCIRKRKSNGRLDAFKSKIVYLIKMLKKKEFYKPIILMFHLHLINLWSGATMIDTYTTDIYSRIVEKDINMSILVLTVDIQRVFTNCVTTLFIKKLPRRIMLITIVTLNIAVYLLIAAYVFAKKFYGYFFNSSLVGVILIHLHIFCIASGSLPLPNIISGEIFALEYRSLSNTIALMFFIANVIVNAKTMLFLFSTIGLYGAYCIYAGIVAYGLIVSWILLPETKDKTLQDIEETFRGRCSSTETKSLGVGEVNMKVESQKLRIKDVNNFVDMNKNDNES